MCEEYTIVFADLGNIWEMHEGMKRAFGPSNVKSAPHKSAEGQIINDRTKQIERCAEPTQLLKKPEIFP